MTKVKSTLRLLRPLAITTSYSISTPNTLPSTNRPQIDTFQDTVTHSTYQQANLYRCSPPKKPPSASTPNIQFPPTTSNLTTAHAHTTSPMSLLHRTLRSLSTKPPLPTFFPKNAYQQPPHTLHSIPYTSAPRSIPLYASRAYSIWRAHPRCMGSTGASVWARGATWGPRTTRSPWQQTRGMKVRSSVKKMCDGCKVHIPPAPIFPSTQSPNPSPPSTSSKRKKEQKPDF